MVMRMRTGWALRNRRTYLYAAAACAVLSAVAGFAAAVLNGRSGEGPPLTGGSAQAGAAALGASSQVADGVVQWPGPLSGLPEAPSHLAVDDSGRLWFPVFTAPPRLYEFDPASGQLRYHELPSDGGIGTGLFSGFGRANNGHLVIAYGYLLVDFDPINGRARRYDLPVPPANFRKATLEEGSWVTDLSLGETVAYLGRMNAASVTAVDLTTGVIREIPMPESFGPVLRLLAAPDGIYVSNIYGAVGIGRQMGLLRYDGKYEGLEGTATDFVLGQGGIVYVSPMGDTPKELRGQQPSDLFTGDTSAISSGIDYLAADEKSGVLWLGSKGFGRVGRVDTASHAVKWYELPGYEVPVSLRDCLPDVPCDGTAAVTSVNGLAVAPDGALYFSTGIGNRIGIIRAGQ